jgi:hypothetical protein
VRAVRVEMLHILAQHDVDVAWSGDQKVVEAFSAQGADDDGQLMFCEMAKPVTPMKMDAVKWVRIVASVG